MSKLTMRLSRFCMVMTVLIARVWFSGMVVSFYMCALIAAEVMFFHNHHLR